MNETEIPGAPTPAQSKAGFVVFFLSAFGIALYFALRGAGIDALSDRGPEVVEKLGGGWFLLLLGKALGLAVVCGLAGAWGFTYPRLYLLGVLGGIFAVVAGPVLVGSIFTLFWATTWGPVLILESGLCFVLAFGMMMKVISSGVPS